ncbi:carboxylesterase family protein [Sphingomonas sp. MMS24-JH45]
MSRTPRFWPKAPDSAVERRLTAAMMDYWLSFARTGSPSAAGQPAWLPYGKAANYMAFERAPRPARGSSGMFALHEAAVCRRRAAGNQPWNWNAGVASPVLARAVNCR